MPRPIKIADRTLKMIEAASHGMTSKEIAEELNLTAPTVERELFQARQMTGACNTTELVAMALRQKWIR